MPNVVIDPGFEIGDPAWVFGANTSRVQAPSPVYAGSWSLRLRKSGTGFGTVNGVAFQDLLPANIGDTVPIQLQTWGDDYAARAGLRAVVDPGDGNLQSFDLSAPLGTGWQLWAPGSVIVAGTLLSIEIRTFSLGPGGIGDWYIDDVSLETTIGGVMQRNGWLAHQALLSVLQGITGASYMTDFKGRAYSRWILPDGPQPVPLPYLCVPLDGRGRRWENADSPAVIQHLPLTIYGYVAESKTSNTESLAVRDALQGEASVLKALLQNPTLNGTIQGMEILDGPEPIAGCSELDGLMWGEFQIPIEVTQVLGADVLGT